MKTWQIVLVAGVLGVGVGVGVAATRLVRWPWDGTPDGVAASSPEHPGAKSNAPQAQALVTTYDFGVMENVSVGKHDFQIRNTGQSTLTLEKGEHSCKCTVSSFGKASLAPGESTAVTIEWHGKDFHGPFRQSVTVITNDPDRNRVSFTITGQMVPAIKAVPPDLALSNIPAGGERSGTVQLFYFKDDKLKLVGHEFSDLSLADRFDVQFEPMPEAQVKAETGAKGGYLIHVLAKPGLPLGAFQQTITLKTDMKALPTFPIAVKGSVVSDVYLGGLGCDAATNTVVLGTIDSEEGVDRTVTLYARGPHAKDVRFKVLLKEPELLEASLGPPLELKGRSMVQTPLRLRVPKGSPPADHLGTESAKPARIVLETGHPQAPRIEVQVRFAVRK